MLSSGLGETKLALLEEAEHRPDELALASHRFAPGLAFGPFAGDIGFGWRVMPDLG